MAVLSRVRAFVLRPVPGASCGRTGPSDGDQLFQSYGDVLAVVLLLEAFHPPGVIRCRQGLRRQRIQAGSWRRLLPVDWRSLVEVGDESAGVMGQFCGDFHVTRCRGVSVLPPVYQRPVHPQPGRCRRRCCLERRGHGQGGTSLLFRRFPRLGANVLPRRHPSPPAASPPSSRRR